MFCPRCRSHWVLEGNKRWGGNHRPRVCPTCSVPLAVDRVESEFPQEDLLAVSGNQVLTVRQVLKETSGDSIATTSMFGDVCLDEHLACRQSRGLWDTFRKWRRMQVVRRWLLRFTGYRRAS